MSHSTHHVYCQRIDSARNMARYYTLFIQPTLFGDIAVVRCWGRIGSRGGEKSELFQTEREAIAHLQRLAARKHRKGYRPIGAA